MCIRDRDEIELHSWQTLDGTEVLYQEGTLSDILPVETILKELEPKFEAQGFKHLGFCELGFRHFTNNKKEVTKASDMKGRCV